MRTPATEELDWGDDPEDMIVLGHGPAGDWSRARPWAAIYRGEQDGLWERARQRGLVAVGQAHRGITPEERVVPGWWVLVTDAPVPALQQDPAVLDYVGAWSDPGESKQAREDATLNARGR